MKDSACERKRRVEARLMAIAWRLGMTGAVLELAILESWVDEYERAQQRAMEAAQGSLKLVPK